MIGERFAYRSQRACAKLVEVAAADAEAGRHIRGLLSPQERQHGLQAMFRWCKTLGCWDHHRGTTFTLKGVQFDFAEHRKSEMKARF
jgi:hypothetical protein